MARIAIAEPYAEVRGLLVLVVERLGHEAVCWSEGDVDYAGIELLLLEPALPGALELARAFRAARPGIPIVLVSILPLTEDFRALRPASYVPKPFKIGELAAGVAAALNGAAAALNGAASVLNDAAAVLTDAASTTSARAL